MADELVAAMMPHLCAPQRDVRVRYTFIMVMAGLLGDVASAEDKRLILLHRQNDGQSRLVKRHEMVVMRLFLLLGLRRRRLLPRARLALCGLVAQVELEEALDALPRQRKPKEEAPAPAEAAPPVEATPPAEATPPPPKPQHLTVKIEIGDGTGEPTKVLLSVAGAAA